MTAPTTNLIESAYITIPGDPSVGIPDHTITVSDLGVDLGCLAEEDRAGHLADVRVKLTELGQLVSNSHAHVLFDFECQDKDPSNG